MAEDSTITHTSPETIMDHTDISVPTDIMDMDIMDTDTRNPTTIMDTTTDTRDIMDTPVDHTDTVSAVDIISSGQFK